MTSRDPPLLLSIDGWHDRRNEATWSARGRAHELLYGGALQLKVVVRWHLSSFRPGHH